MSEEIGNSESHTPAPWKGMHNGEIFGPQGDIIATCWDNPGEEESGFNVALICAAPEMASILKKLTANPLFTGIDSRAMQAIISEAKAVIKKTEQPI